MFAKFRFNRFGSIAQPGSVQACRRVALRCIVGIGLLVTSTAVASTASAQSLGQQAAAAVRQQAVENALAERGVNIDLSRRRRHFPQSNYYTRRPAIGYGAIGHGYGYGNGYGRGFGYGYAHRYGYAPGYGYNPYGSPLGYYNPGLYGHRFGTSVNRGRSLGNRQSTTGSNYFGSPHASQYIPGSR